jgi:hypothetical protein
LSFENCPYVRAELGEADGERSELHARDSRDLYRLAVFFSSTPLVTARSIAEIVGDSSLLAAVGSPEPRALLSDFIMERTRVRLDLFTAARVMDCAARLSTDFLRFLTFVAVPWAIQSSFAMLFETSTVADA